MNTAAADPKLAHAERAAQQIAARGRGNAYVVAVRGPQRYDVETGDKPPTGKHVVAVYLSGGKKGTVHGQAPRECRKTYDLYERDNPVAPIGTIKGQTRGEAYGLARQAHPGLDLVLGVAGPGSRDEVVRAIEREEKKAQAETDKTARRSARLAKEAERERLKESRERSLKFQAERQAKADRIEAEDARRQSLGLAPTGDDPADRTKKAYNVSYRSERMDSFGPPAHLCEIIARSEDEARDAARRLYGGATQLIDGVTEPTDLERLEIRRLARVVDQEEDCGWERGEPLPTASMNEYITASRTATEAAIRAELDRVEADAVDSEEEDHQAEPIEDPDHDEPHPTAEAGDYHPGHPWYYKLGGETLTPDAIQPEEKLIGWRIESIGKELSENRVRRLLQIARRKEDAENGLETDLARYLELVERGPAALTDHERDSSDMAYYSALALKHNHILAQRGTLAALERLRLAHHQAEPPRKPREKKAPAPDPRDFDKDAFPIQPGMIVQTSYNTGPYRVESLNRSTSVYCGACGRQHTVAETLIDMVVTKPGEPGKKTFFYLKGYHVAPDGRIVVLDSPCTSRKARPNALPPDEITIIQGTPWPEGGDHHIEQDQADDPQPFPHWQEHQAEEEDDEPTPPAPPRWEVYRITLSGRLWAAGTRLRHSKDPEPAEQGQWRKAHYIGNGKAISWDTDRAGSQTFAHAGNAARYVIAQGWKPEDIRVIRSDAEPSIDDEPPRIAAKEAPDRGTPGRIAQAQAYREERASGERPGFPVTSGSVGGGYPLKGAPGPQPQSAIPPAMTSEQLRQADAACICTTQTVKYHGGKVRDVLLLSEECPTHGRKKPAYTVEDAHQEVERAREILINEAIRNEFGIEPAPTAEPFDLAAAIAENAAIKSRADQAQAAIDAKKVKARDPKAPKPYGWDFLATFRDGTERRIARAGSSENTARKSALRGKDIVSVRDPEPLTEEQYSRAYGSRKTRM